MAALSFSKKADLIEALEGTRSFCRKVDKRRTAEHRKAEADAFKAWQKELREALACKDYAAAKAWVERRGKAGSGWRSRSIEFDPPACPRSQEGNLDRLIARLNLTHQERFTVERSGRWGDVWSVLMAPINAATSEDVCE